MIKKSIILILICLLMLFFYLTYFFVTPFIDNHETFYFEIKPGDSFSVSMDNLSAKYSIHSPLLFKLLVYLSDSDKKIQAGIYQISPKTSPISLLKKLCSGDVYTELLTLVNGKRTLDLIKEIQMNPWVRNTSHLQNQWKTFLSAKSLPFEGQLLAQTYRIKAGESGISILSRAHQVLEQKLESLVGTCTLKAEPYNPQQLLTIASIIEKESGLGAERPLVGSVIYNRLEKNMRLQMDPTVIYGLGESYSPPLTRKELRIDTPYNTYLHKGLPPSPIAIVGESALQAACHPADTDYLYFVLKGDGTHHFSNTLEEQNRMIAKIKANKVNHEQ